MKSTETISLDIVRIILADGRVDRDLSKYNKISIADKIIVEEILADIRCNVILVLRKSHNMYDDIIQVVLKYV